jgi:hypothetical protein
MKFRISKESGGVLLVVLFSSIVMGITLASFLQYTSTQSRSIMRSQAWNAAIPVAESGVEEALAHINDSIIGTNYALNGWTVVSNQFQKAGTINGGRYVAAISTNKFPVIICTGYTTDGNSAHEFARTVRVTTSRWATGLKGIVAKDNVRMVGITTVDSFDSEDERYSTRGRYDASKHKDGGYVASVTGNVVDATVNGMIGTGPTGTATGNVGDFAWMASSTGIQPGHYENDVNYSFLEVQVPFEGGASTPAPGWATLTNFSYWSTMITTTNYPSPAPASPVTTNFFGTNVVTTYPSGVSSLLVTTNLTTGLRSKTQPAAGSYINGEWKGAWFYYDAITSYSYPMQTYTYSMTATNNSVTNERYEYILTNERYEMSHLRMSSTDRLLVLGTNVTLYVDNDFTMSGQSQVIIAPGANLNLYVGGDVTLSGQGIFNYTLDATHFSLYGLPSVRNISIAGNAAFTGVIYAPTAAVYLKGGGVTTYDVVGAIVGASAVMDGHFQFHYDERLGRSKVLSKYSVASWQEL